MGLQRDWKKSCRVNVVYSTEGTGLNCCKHGFAEVTHELFHGFEVSSRRCSIIINCKRSNGFSDSPGYLEIHFSARVSNSRRCEELQLFQFPMYNTNDKQLKTDSILLDQTTCPCAVDYIFFHMDP